MNLFLYSKLFIKTDFFKFYILFGNQSFKLKTSEFSNNMIVLKTFKIRIMKFLLLEKFKGAENEVPKF